MFEDVGGSGAWNQRWVVLSAMTLEYWRYPDYENRNVSSVALVIIHQQCYSHNFVQPELDTRLQLILNIFQTVLPLRKRRANRHSCLLDQPREVDGT